MEYLNPRGVALAKYPIKQLSRERAIEIISYLSMLVAASKTLFKIGSIIQVPYEVLDESYASYTFENQPFKILRRITLEEFKTAIPQGLTTGLGKGYRNYYYEIHTD